MISPPTRNAGTTGAVWSMAARAEVSFRACGGHHSNLKRSSCLGLLAATDLSISGNTGGHAPGETDGEISRSTARWSLLPGKRYEPCSTDSVTVKVNEASFNDTASLYSHDRHLCRSGSQGANAAKPYGRFLSHRFNR